MLTAHLHTAPTPGAVGIIQLTGEPMPLTTLLGQLTGRHRWQDDYLYLAPFADIDSGLTCIHPTTDQQDVAWLMPHGGPRVIERLLDWLAEHNCPLTNNALATTAYPEADSPLEADALTLISKAASPMAVDLLLNQSQYWRSWLTLDAAAQREAVEQACRHAVTFDSLVTPPIVLVIGQPNVGKSTLTNRMLGRSASVVADLPGTTRDWVGAVAELGPAHQAVAVKWIDTPGLRHSDDAIEQRAITLAYELLPTAQVIIAMRSPDTDWPDLQALPRKPDVWAINKADQWRNCPRGDGGSATSPLALSARGGEGLDQLESAVLQCLGLFEIDPASPWAFSDQLRVLCDGGEPREIASYIAGARLTPSTDA